MPANGREESYPRFQKLWGQILPYLADSDDCTVRPPDRSLKHSIVVERNHKRNTRFSQKCLFGLLRQFEISCFCSRVVKQNIVDGAPPCRSSSHARSTAVGTTVSIETSLSIHWSPASHRSLWFWPPTVKFFDVFSRFETKVATAHRCQTIRTRSFNSNNPCKDSFRRSSLKSLNFGPRSKEAWAQNRVAKAFPNTDENSFKNVHRLRVKKTTYLGICLRAGERSSLATKKS